MLSILFSLNGYVKHEISKVADCQMFSGASKGHTLTIAKSEEFVSAFHVSSACLYKCTEHCCPRNGSKVALCYIESMPNS